ncbi:MAG: polysaccharide-degrading enzyme [bacterium]|nr:polysaccharide-degrading enzyme [bacterium]
MIGSARRPCGPLGQFAWFCLLLVLPLAGCGDDPAAPEDPVPVDPPSSAWDPADFTQVYEVGPGLAYADPGQVPWESLGPSTLVLIRWRAEPYRTKWVINTVATAAEPLVVLGVPDAGRRPVISGENATTRQELSYWNEVRSVVKVGGSNLPTDDLVPAHVVIQGLEIRSGQPAYGFTDDTGNPQVYAENAAAIHAEIGAHVTIRDCVLTDAGNGLFAGSQVSDLLVSHNHIHGNGIDGSIYHHNSYTECLGIVFEGNHYGPLRAGALGNNLKDRSAGTVIRYNWIENGNRQLDLVETDHTALRDDPSYDVTWVYGNILVEPDGAGNSQIVHYGGDGGDEAWYRHGTLHFYHNTVWSTRAGNTTVLRCATNDVTVDLRGNVLANSAGGSYLAITSGRGQLALRDNWLPTGWRTTHEGFLEGAVLDLGNLTGSTPGFADTGTQDFTPAADSACQDGAGPLAAATASHPVALQYAPHLATAARADRNDVGALER